MQYPNNGIDSLHNDLYETLDKLKSKERAIILGNFNSYIYFLIDGNVVYSYIKNHVSQVPIAYHPVCKMELSSSVIMI